MKRELLESTVNSYSSDVSDQVALLDCAGLVNPWNGIHWPLEPDTK